ncbi:cyclase family protein [Halolamina salina]|uniref:Cyclase family protein n=1 Tax=Halolamina salina TaxID=1220023 RepID=A0ABD6B3L4_9EURY
MQDLTHSIESGMPVYPGDPAVSVDAADTFAADGCRVSELTCGSHAGTHVDAPSHTEEDGDTLDTYPVSAFVRDAVVVDCTDLDAREPIPADRVPDPETAPGADCAVFRTGWDRHWGRDRYRDHPYLSVAAAERCAARGLAVAIDAFSPDPTPPAEGSLALDGRDAFGAHHALLGAGVLVFENLTNLGSVPARFELRAQPIALGGDGAPVRAVAVEGADRE